GPDNRHEAEAFVLKWRDVADKVDLQRFIDFSNVHKLKDLEVDELFCPMPWNRVNVWATGDMSPCCTFYGKHFLFGNIHQQGIKQFWDSPRVAALRRSLIAGPFPKACKNCYGNLGGR
ncbi:MAG: SPASM domain-containing protein, partial [Desulfovibrionaceae bacterium]|nr:SPASM domain-containing protein [Desulfovibrionaceae bacterium]